VLVVPVVAQGPPRAGADGYNGPDQTVGIWPGPAAWPGDAGGLLQEEGDVRSDVLSEPVVLDGQRPGRRAGLDLGLEPGVDPGDLMSSGYGEWHPSVKT